MTANTNVMFNESLQYFNVLQYQEYQNVLINIDKAPSVSRPVLRRSYLLEGQGVRAWSSGKTERLCSVVALPEG